MYASDNGYSSNPQVNRESTAGNDYFLILHNDDINTFEHVIKTLVEVCEHDFEQAEQCALITHYKGYCDVKKGPFAELHGLKDQLHSKGLIVSVE